MKGKKAADGFIQFFEKLVARKISFVMIGVTF